MSYYDEFSDEIKDQVDVWEQTETDLKDQIDVQTELVKKYTALIDSDMEKGDAQDQTVKNSLNCEYAKKRLEKAQTELAEHEAMPLYSLDEYDKECGKIVNTYKADIIKDREKLQNAIGECLQILEDMDTLGLEAGKCESLLKRACRDCGENVNEELRMSKYYTGLHTRVTPTFVRDFIQTLEKIELRLRQ